MNSDDVRTFVAVVEAGSISAAARELFLTQPAVSRRVQRLEQAIGAPLIDRRKRPFALTDVGRAAVERCRRLLSTTDELKGLVQGGILPSQELRIGVAHALTELTLAEPVDAVRQEFPGVSVRLHTGWSSELLARVRRGALGASVILLFERNGAPSGVSAQKLASEHLAVVAPRTWPSHSYPMRELANMGWILNPEGCAARAELERQLAREQLPLRVSVETYNYELQLRLIARGRGLGLVPSRLFLRSPTREKLRKLRVRGLSFPMTVWLVAGEVSQSVEPALGALQRVLTSHLSKASLRGHGRRISGKGKKRP